MNTKVEIIDENNINNACLEETGEIIRRGGTVIFPTETVYGLGANALNAEAVKKIFIAKGRPQDNPLIVHISDYTQINSLVTEVPEVAQKFMDKFWPGPLTIILNKSDIIPNETSACLPSVGIRMPSNIIAREFIKACRVPIAAPSANISGRPSPTDVERCIEDMEGKVDYILGGGRCHVGLESTVVDCTSFPPCVLRPGGVTLEMLREVEENTYIDPAIMKKPEGDLKPKAPGMKYRHYAPKAPVKIISGDLEKTIEKINEIVQNNRDSGKKVGIMATDETVEFYKNAEIISLGSRKDLSSIGYNLFEGLRALDDRNVDLILSEAFDEKDMGIAVMNRLQKSAGFNIIKV